MHVGQSRATLKCSHPLSLALLDSPSLNPLSSLSHSLSLSLYRFITNYCAPGRWRVRYLILSDCTRTLSFIINFFKYFLFAIFNNFYIFGSFQFFLLKYMLPILFLPNKFRDIYWPRNIRDGFDIVRPDTSKYVQKYFVI